MRGMFEHFPHFFIHRQYYLVFNNSCIISTYLNTIRQISTIGLQFLANVIVLNRR